MIVFSAKSNFWHQFGVFLLQLHSTHATRKIVTPFFPAQNFVFKFWDVNFSKQRSGITFLRALDRNN